MCSIIHRLTIYCAMLFITLFMAFPTAWALSLAEAKAKGMVGEQPNGYLGAVSGSASSEVRSLIKSVNHKRKQKYQEIAKRNKTNLQAVEILAGKTAIKKTRPGNYIQLPSGQWTKK